MCDPHRIAKRALARRVDDPDGPGCVVYSIGSNGDFSFELGLQREVGEDVCEFHVFDPGDFAGKVPSELRRVHYHRWGLGKETTTRTSFFASERYRSLRDTVKLLGHEGLDAIDVFVSRLPPSIAFASRSM